MNEDNTIQNLQDEIRRDRKAQQQYAFGHKKQNAEIFGAYERKIESMYRELGQLTQKQDGR